MKLLTVVKIFAVCQARLHYAFAEMNLKRSKTVEVFELRLRSLKLASFSPFIILCISRIFSIASGRTPVVTGLGQRGNLNLAAYCILNPRVWIQELRRCL